MNSVFNTNMRISTSIFSIANNLFANPRSSRNGMIRTATTFLYTKSNKNSNDHSVTSNNHNYNLKKGIFETKCFSSFHLDSEEAKYIDMFCRQCEQAKNGVGCTTVGVCGKSPESSALQDTLVHLIKCMSSLCVAVRNGCGDEAEEALKEASTYTLEATFSTLTNVNFSESRIVHFIHEGMIIVESLKKLLQSKGVTNPIEDVLFPETNMTMSELEDFGKDVGIVKRQDQFSDMNCLSLAEIAMYGMKGLSAYAAHCHRLGYMEEENIMKPLHEVWSDLLYDSNAKMDSLFKTILRVGEINANVLSLLDKAHSSTLGKPEIKKVLTTTVKGKCILVSGHDLLDLYDILLQTEGTGINVYTHGEMVSNSC
jgi:hydroxylamine reductase